MKRFLHLLLSVEFDDEESSPDEVRNFFEEELVGEALPEGATLRILTDDEAKALKCESQ